MFADGLRATAGRSLEPGFVLQLSAFAIHHVGMPDDHDLPLTYLAPPCAQDLLLLHGGPQYRVLMKKPLQLQVQCADTLRSKSEVLTHRRKRSHVVRTLLFSLCRLADLHICCKPVPYSLHQSSVLTQRVAIKGG